jgi:hypothetical protein
MLLALWPLLASGDSEDDCGEADGMSSPSMLIRCLLAIFDYPLETNVANQIGLCSEP